MDDRMRVSDADREKVTARLREHFAEGRLTQEELDERVTAALSAKTVGELRRVLVDLPDPEPAGAQAGPGPSGGWTPPWAPGRVYAYRRGPRLLPLALFILVLALILPGAGWVFFGIFKFLLLLWLIACVAGIFAAFRLRRRVRRYWRSGWGQGPGGSGWGGFGWGGPGPAGRGGPGGRGSGWGGFNPWHQDPDE